MPDGGNYNPTKSNKGRKRSYPSGRRRYHSPPNNRYYEYADLHDSRSGDYPEPHSPPPNAGQRRDVQFSRPRSPHSHHGLPRRVRSQTPHNRGYGRPPAQDYNYQPKAAKGLNKKSASMNICMKEAARQSFQPTGDATDDLKQFQKSNAIYQNPGKPPKPKKQFKPNSSTPLTTKELREIALALETADNAELQPSSQQQQQPTAKAQDFGKPVIPEQLIWPNSFSSLTHKELREIAAALETYENTKRQPPPYSMPKSAVLTPERSDITEALETMDDENCRNLGARPKKPKPTMVSRNALTMDSSLSADTTRMKQLEKDNSPSDIHTLLNPIEDPNDICYNEYCQVRMKFSEGHKIGECQAWRFKRIAHNINRAGHHKQPVDYIDVDDTQNVKIAPIQVGMALPVQLSTPKVFEKQPLGDNANATSQKVAAATITPEAVLTFTHDRLMDPDLTKRLGRLTVSQVIQLLLDHKENNLQDYDTYIIDVIYQINLLHLFRAKVAKWKEPSTTVWSDADIRTWMHHITPFQDKVQHPSLAPTRNLLYMQALTEEHVHEQDPMIIAHYSALNWAYHHSVSLYYMDQNLHHQYDYPIYITALPESAYTIWDLPALYALWLRASFYHRAHLPLAEWIPMVFSLFSEEAYSWLKPMKQAMLNEPCACAELAEAAAAAEYVATGACH